MNAWLIQFNAKLNLMKKLFRIVVWTGLAVLLLIFGFFTLVQITWDNAIDAPYPDIRATSDPAVIARGEYLVYGPSHCAVCHVSMDRMLDVDNGLKLPLTGGFEEVIPGFGIIRAPNLTPDEETGIGRLTDGEIARSLRHMVSSDGRPLFPFMEFQEMSDEDLTAIISYLRSLEPVRNQVKPTEYTFMGKALLAFGLFKAKGPDVTPPVSITPDTTIAYGRYLAHDVANCRSCHTSMDNQGNPTGPDFSGGFVFHPTEWSQGYTFVSPNITPHETSGIMAHWTEEVFINRFRAGRAYERSHMPWGSYSRMSDDDLKAIYRYLQSLDPVDNKVARTVYFPGEHPGQ